MVAIDNCERGGATPAESVREGPLADLLRTGTRDLHGRAERSGVLADLLRGRVDRYGYALLLRHLLPVYRSLEAGLARHRGSPGARRLYQPAVFRSAALESDLAALWGASWEATLPFLPAGECYVRRVERAAADAGVALIAHAYVRYLGDLNGGQVLRALVAEGLGIGPSALAFYEFTAIEDLAAFRRAYRRAVDLAGSEAGRPARLLTEARAAFALNIAVSEAVAASAGRRSHPGDA